MKMDNSIKIDVLRLCVTGECNLSCAYCLAADMHLPENIRRELSINELIEIVKEANKLGCKQFIFSGGEPFLKKGFLRLLERTEGEITISTNGTCLNQTFVNKLKHLNIRKFRLSLDGLDSHDRLRKGSTYGSVIENINLLKKNFPYADLTVQTIITRQSLKEMMPLYEILKKTGISKWRISPSFRLGNGLTYRKQFESENIEMAIQNFKKLIKQYWADKPQFRLQIYNIYDSLIRQEGYGKFDAESHPCMYNLNSVSIRPNGDLTFCGSLNEPLANVRAKGLINAFKSKKLIESREWRLSKLPCKNCRYLAVCGGGCRADALAFTGSLMSADPVACMTMPLWEKYILPILQDEERSLFYDLIDEQGTLPQYSGIKINELKIAR